jgi:hypothetical protein
MNHFLHFSFCSIHGHLKMMVIHFINPNCSLLSLAKRLVIVPVVLRKVRRHLRGNFFFGNPPGSLFCESSLSVTKCIHCLWWQYISFHNYLFFLYRRRCLNTDLRAFFASSNNCIAILHARSHLHNQISLNFYYTFSQQTRSIYNS